MLQLRPSLKYLDRIDEKLKSSMKAAEGEDDTGTSATAAKPAKAKAIQVSWHFSLLFGTTLEGYTSTFKFCCNLNQVQVRSAEEEDQQRRQQSSLTYLQQQIEEEPWQRLDYYNSQTDEAYEVRENILTKQRKPFELQNRQEELYRRNQHT